MDGDVDDDEIRFWLCMVLKFGVFLRSLGGDSVVDEIEFNYVRF